MKIATWNINSIRLRLDNIKRLIHDTPMIGIINGMYATSNGNGGITPIQIYPNLQQNENKYEIKITGKQGEVMKESVMCSLTCALEYLKSKKYDINQLFSNDLKYGFHLGGRSFYPAA